MEGRLGLGKDPGQPHHGSSGGIGGGGGIGNVNGSIASSRIASSTATATIVQSGKVKRIASEADNRRRLNTGDDTTENGGDDDENFWNELDEVSGNLKADAEQAQPAGRGRSSHGHRPQSKSNSSQAIQPAQRREIEEQLAETLYKRAQAKMMLPVHEDSVIESALVDAWRVSRMSWKTIAAAHAGTAVTNTVISVDRRSSTSTTMMISI